MDTDSDPFSFAQITTLDVPSSIILILVLILFNAFFAMTEISLVSVRKTRIKQLAEEGVQRARNVQKLLDDPTRFLATIQIGVTLVGFFASAAGAVTLAEPLAQTLQEFPVAFIANNAMGFAVVFVTLIIVYFSIVIGEISPKSMALQHAEKIALWTSGPLLFLSFIFSPLVKIITLNSNALVKPLGGTASFSPPIISEEELKMLVQAGEEEGVLEEEEREMIHSIFEFTDTVVRKVMVPRIDIKAVQVDASVDELLEIIIKAGHSRVPVYKETVDNIIGIVHAKDVLRALHENGDKEVSVRELMRPPFVIPENKKVDELLAELKKNKIQMAIVVDEYGGTAGLATIEDLVEEIVGEIMDEYDIEVPMIEAVDENTLVVDAKIPVNEVNEMMDVSLPEEEFDTIGGFVFGILGKPADQGDVVEYDGVSITVEQTDGRRIQKVKIFKFPSPIEEDIERKVEGKVFEE